VPHVAPSSCRLRGRGSSQFEFSLTRYFWYDSALGLDLFVFWNSHHILLNETICWHICYA
jgi:hypothetical protein